MGSLRNPVGPLPSSIYWRRRAFLLSVLGLLALVGVWMFASGGGGGKNRSGGPDGKNPVSTITPGPTGSGPAISQHPGGRDESSGTASGTASGGGDTSGSDAGAGASGGDGSGASGDESTGGGSGGQLPSGSTLPNCTASIVKLTLRSVHNSYGPGQTPTFQLIAGNSSSSDCKVDLGPRSAVLTITQADSDNDIWSSDDCPAVSGSVLYRVPAGGSATYTVKWDRKPSVPECATPPAGSASAGTYLVEAKAPGFAKAQMSFVLAKD